MACKGEHDRSVVQIHNDLEPLLSRLRIMDSTRTGHASLLSLMLNVWKRTWKGNDSSPKRFRLDEPSNTASSLDVAGAVHPSDTMSLHPADVATSPLKAQSPFQGREQLDLSFENQIFCQAKFENIIAFVPHSLSITNILVRYLDWAVGIERARHMITNKRHRSAFLVADDPSSVGLYGVVIKHKNPTLGVGIYDKILRDSKSEPWTNILEHDVVIITSTLLLDSLVRGTLAITQIHSLIFCDGENMLGPESQLLFPVMRIMKDFYHITDTLSRPRILVLAAFSAGAGFQNDPAMLELENIFDSKILGVTSERRGEILAVVNQPQQVVILFDDSNRHGQPTLIDQLLKLDSSESLFPGYYKASRDAFVQLGSCASDLIWRRAQKKIDTESLSQNDEMKASVIRDVIKNWAFTMPNLDPSSRSFNVTMKFLQLVRVLEACEPYGECFRGIVFVREETIAQIIADLLRMLSQSCWLHPGTVGNGSLEHRHQLATLDGFTIGTYNLLIAVAREDIHLPKASTVICFDSFDEILQASIRRAARGHESHLIHMVQEGDHVHRRVLSKSLDVSPSTDFFHPQPLSSLPKSSESPSISNETDHPTFIQDPTTGRRIYPHDSVNAINLLHSGLHRDSQSTAHEEALFQFNELSTRGTGSEQTYSCTISLPGFHRITGPTCTSKDLAKQSACYRVCQELFARGLLDYRLYPQGEAAFEGGHSMNDTGTQQSGTRSYPRKEPEFWANVGSAAVTSLFSTVISPSPAAVERSVYSSLAILTRQPLPELIGSVKLFDATVPITVVLERAAPLQLNEGQLQDLYRYTLRMFRTITNKPYESPMEGMLYFIVPLTETWKTCSETTPRDPFSFPSIADYIPWDLVALAGRYYAIPLTITPLDQEMQDVVIQDRWVEFTRRYRVVRIRSDLTPLSKPVDSPREADYNSLLDFCKARVKGFDGLKDLEQPLIEVSTIPPLTNLLNPTSRPLPTSPKAHAKYLIPELCAKFTIPASTLLTALLVPSITQRINDFLLVKELNARLFNHAISEDLLHIALCTPSYGVEYDYERLELLGDAFLKYLSTIYVFVTNPTFSEGALHSERQQLISNKSLFHNARHKGLPAYIQSKPFTPRSWHPPNFVLSVPEKNATGKSSNVEEEEGYMTPVSDPVQLEPSGSDTKTSTSKGKGNAKGKKKRKTGENIQWLSDKAIADVAEAVIGAAYLTGGRDIALRATKALGIPVLHINEWSDLRRKGIAPAFKTTNKIGVSSIRAIEDLVQRPILRPDLLAQALTHSSTRSTGSISYERMEFVGDAILDFMVIRHLFYREKELNPGGLTLLKGAMVSNSALAAACVFSGLHEHFVHESPLLGVSIQQYISKLQSHQKKEYEAAASEGRSPGQYWLGLEAPKALSDVIESVIGAIYVSDDFSPLGAEAFFENLLKPFYDKHISLKTLSHHPTKNLFELLQARGCQRFKMLKERTKTGIISCQVLVHDVILTNAENPLAAVAARRASLFALDALEGDANFLTRVCDCRSKSKPTKREREEAESMLKLEEEERDMLAVEDELVEIKNAKEEESELEEGMIVE